MKTMLSIVLLIALAGAIEAKPLTFNPKASAFKGKLIVAKTFATWCGYCRQSAVNAKEQGHKFDNEKVVEVVLTPADNFAASQRFFAGLGVQKNLFVVKDAQLNAWSVIYFPSLLIFKDGKLVKMIPGELKLKEMDDAVAAVLSK